MFAPAPPTVAIELACRRLTVVEMGGTGKGAAVVGYASEALPAEAIVPSATGVNIPNAGVVVDALKRALDRAGVRSTRHAALIVPDSVARMSLLTFEQLPAKTADAEQLIRWQLKKATPYPIEEARVTWFPAYKTDAALTVGAAAARHDVIAEYESIANAVGIHAGLVDIASLNVMNAVIAASAAATSDWLLITISPDATALAIGRGADLMFYRHRSRVENEPLSALVHQTAMYHEDRLGGSKFSRVWLCGAGLGREAEQTRQEITQRLGAPVEAVDVRAAADLGGRITASTDVLDALAAPVGVLLRERRAA
jgi:Tfp pilus assembly PilM family ATPase